MYTGSQPLGQGFQRRVTQYPDAAAIGLITEIRSSVDAFYPISGSYQTYLIALGALAANTDYVFRVESYDLTINSGTLSATDFQALVLEKLQEDSQVGALFTIELDGTDIKLTNRNPGALINAGVSGGSAAISATAPSTQSILPLGRLLMLDSATNLSNSLPSVKVIEASAKPYGIGGLWDHSNPRIYDPTIQREVAGYAPGTVVSVLRSGLIYVPMEAECGAGSEIYFREAADGDLNMIGGFAPAAGTGLVKLPGAQAIRQTERLSTGELTALVEFDILVGA